MRSAMMMGAMLCGVSGLAMGAGPIPGAVAGAVYIDAVSGERVMSPVAPAGVRRGAEPRTRVWVNNNGDPCGVRGFAGDDGIEGTEDDRVPNLVRILSVGTEDGSAPGGGSGFPPRDSIEMHWGDVPADSRVNSVGFWVWHDYRGDGIETEIAGFDMTLAFFDGANGFNQGTATMSRADETPGALMPVRELVFADLPAADPFLSTGYLNGFYFLVDLESERVGGGFELGDTDGVGPASGDFNAMSYYDSPNDAVFAPSGVGLHDFGYSIGFTHPTDRAPAFAGIAVARGDVGTGALPFVDNGVPAGWEDFFDSYSEPLDAVTGLPVPSAFEGVFGGLYRCDFEDKREPARAYLELYFDEPEGVCRADWDGSGSVDIFDIIAFLGDWNAAMGMTGPGVPADFDGDEAVDVFDILAFLGAWNMGSAGAGCSGTP